MQLFTLDDLEQIAGEKSYDRGLSYIDAIEQFSADDHEIQAMVNGREQYRVRLDISDLAKSWCDCPWNEEGNFCKHCVATGVYYLYQVEHGNEIPEPLDIKGYLESLSHNQLVELVLEASKSNFELEQYLQELLDPSEDYYCCRECG